MALLEIKDLHVSYGSVRALNGINISVNKGQIVALVGANGAGKSTLLDAISGRVPFSQGEILYENASLPRRVEKIVRKGITQVPEGRQIFADLTVEENLIVGGYTLTQNESNKMREELYKTFPLLHERRNQDAGTLSGGEQQQLAIARGLISKPDLIMLDEPSLGLAPIIVNTVFDFIEKIKVTLDKTVLLVEQNAMKALSVADYCYVIENGKIRIEGTAKEMMSNQDIVAAYLGEKM